MNKENIADTLVALFVTAVLVVFFFLVGKLWDSTDLVGVGSCVEQMAIQEGFTGTSKEKWDIFSEYCSFK